ncbi:MAG: patatin, partial [Bacteroidota bacterium]
LDYFDLRERYTPGSTSALEDIVKENHNWFRAKIEIDQYFRKGKYSTGYYVGGVFSNQPFFTNFSSTLVSFSGFEPLQDSKTLFLRNFRSPKYAAVGLRNIYSLRQNLEFRLEGYAFLPFERIEQTIDQRPISRNFEDVYLAGSASLTLHSPVGPINLSLNYYDDADNQFGVLLHLGYLLFKEKSLE